TVTASAVLAAHNATQGVAISLAAVNHPPPGSTPFPSTTLFRSTAITNVVYTAHATDADGTPANNTITYSIGGTDSGAFNIDSTTRERNLHTPPNHHTPPHHRGPNNHHNPPPPPPWPPPAHPPHP